METYYFIGRIAEKKEIRSGETSGFPWQRQDIVLEQFLGDQYRPNRILMSAFGRRVDELEEFAVGDKVKAGFQIYARESSITGKLYNNIDLVSIESAAGMVNEPAPKAAPLAEEEDRPF